MSSSLLSSPSPSLLAPSSSPLPEADPIDLTDPASLTWWRASPPSFRGQEGALFWRRMPPLTIPQYLALRLGRHPDHVSLASTSSILRQWQESSRNWQSAPLDRYPTLWRRTHRTTVFRFDARRVGRSRPLAAANPLRQLAGWVDAETELEAQYLIAGCSTRRTWRENARRVDLYLRHGERLGYIRDVRQVEVPPRVFRPSAAWCRQMGVTPPRWKDTAIEHGQLAVDALLRIMGADPVGVGALHILRSEAELLSQQRKLTGRSAAGDELGGVVDLEGERHSGARVWVEVLSEDYRNDDLVEKHRALHNEVYFVATSRTVGRRVSRAMPRAPWVYHF